MTSPITLNTRAMLQASVVYELTKAGKTFDEVCEVIQKALDAQDNEPRPDAALEAVRGAIS